jgi:hypothetical protein
VGALVELGAENALSLADEPIAVLRERVLLGLRYTFSWLKAVRQSVGAFPVVDAVSGGPTIADAAGWELRIREMQTALRGLLDIMPPSDVFPGNDVVAAYERVSHGYAQLYRDLSLSMSSLPARGLLDQASDLVDAVFQAPAAAATAIAESASNAIARLLGGTAAAIWSALWPWLLVAGAAGLVYVFRAPLGRAIGKVAA